MDRCIVFEYLYNLVVSEGLDQRPHTITVPGKAAQSPEEAAQSPWGAPQSHTLITMKGTLTIWTKLFTEMCWRYPTHLSCRYYNVMTYSYSTSSRETHLGIHAYTIRWFVRNCSSRHAGTLGKPLTRNCL